ncbi:hypothetical protein [Persicitalea jodogahamensis]|uniref:hypothetical protein n=1 Tax=Persicitalea jodogahamensis TaxID=402147 RepID=UPI001678644D|nr:hypothetical protein [Persicitalea jodogahamensis]
MKKRITIFAATSMLAVAGLAYGYGFKATESACPLEGTADCPKIDCPLAGTPDCPYENGTVAELPACCAKK